MSIYVLGVLIRAGHENNIQWFVMWKIVWQNQMDLAVCIIGSPSNILYHHEFIYAGKRSFQGRKSVESFHQTQLCFDRIDAAIA
jgi:hypothetical protein